MLLMIERTNFIKLMIKQFSFILQICIFYFDAQYK